MQFFKTEKTAKLVQLQLKLNAVISNKVDQIGNRNFSQHADDVIYDLASSTECKH